MRTRLAAVPLLLFFALGISAQEAPTQQRGFAPDKVFHVDELDAVNTFNGNLAIHIPIGPSFPVNGTLSYGLTLFYNSKVWDWESDTVNGGANALPNRHSNAGMGWQVSMGRLEPPTSFGNDSPDWMFEDSDGSQHGLNGQLHPGVPGTSGISYSNDSSYIRASVSSGPPFVELGDGRIDYFDTSGRLTSSQDRFGNSFTVTYYDSSAPACGTSDTAEWDIHDSQTNRHAYICLADHINGLSTNYPSVYGGRFITKIILPTPPGNGIPSTYTFAYTGHTINAPCPSNDQSPKSIPMLSTLTLPDASQYVFTYNDTLLNTDTSPNNCQLNGTLATMWLPTGALVSYTYTSYDEPVEVCSGGIPWFDQVVGIASKTVTGSKIPSATWSYAQSNNKSTLQDNVRCSKIPRKPDQPPPDCVANPADCVCKRPPPDRMVTTVTDPLGNVSEHYYSIWPGGADALRTNDANCSIVQQDGSVSENGVHDYEYGLPYTKDQTLASGSFLLSTRTYTPSGYANGKPSRSQYVTYDQELFGIGDGPCLAGSSWCTSINRRVSGERTTYFDGNGNEIDHSDVTRDNFDGLGHYRHEVLGGSFTAGGADITTAWNQRDSNVNPAQAHDGFIESGIYPSSFVMPPVTQPWILNTLSSITHVEDNSTAIEHRCYDPATGFLLATRQLKQPTDTEDSTDLVTVRTQTQGNATREDFYGGDLSHNAPTAASLCAFAASPGTTPEKTVNHTYTTGVLATSKYSGASFYSTDLTIDPQTGLPTQSRGTDGLTTFFNYDTSFRLASIQPPGVAATIYTYSNFSGNGSGFVAAAVDEKTTTSSAGTIEHIYQYDDLGHLWREKRQMPDNSWSLRETLRNANAWTTSVSEWQTLSGNESTFTPSHLTTFGNFDPFGRVGLTTAPDDGPTHMRQTVTTYGGVSSLTRTVKVHLAAGDTDVTTSEAYDRQGRLLSTTTDNFTATYAYDVGGRLRLVSMPGEGGTQFRTFQYDRRGLLTSETHPELGSTGNGSITYSNYDALGKAHRRTRGGLDLAFDYDGAERVSRVYPYGSTSSWKQFLYDDPNGTTYPQCAGEICNGKVVASIRWNQYPDAAHLQTVTETWRYDPSTGLANQRDDSVSLTGDAFRVQRSFNDAGLVSSTTYPCRVSGISCADSPRTVTNGYTRGLLNSVGTWADAISYQANGMVASVHHTNGTSEIWTPDPNGMARPCSIIGTGSGGTVVPSSSDPCGSVLQGSGWTSGQYLYDGAGNVTQIGTKTYQYDVLSRLAGWTSPSPTGGTVSTNVSLDAYGNLLSTKVARCVAAGACFHSSSVAGQISGTTNHYVNVTYDAAGNVTNDGRQFTYDTVGMMATSVIGGRSYRYLYTADDERIGVVEVTGTPVYTWTIRGFGNEILRNYRGTGAGMAWLEDEIWRGGSLLANERPSLTRHYALDHLGSPRALTSSTGTLLGTQDFQPYGGGGTTDGGALQFTGHERDAELLADTSGSMPDYFHARNYDTARGRFLAVDPNINIDAALHQPQGWHRYVYVSNNPVTLLDPDGREQRFNANTYDWGGFIRGVDAFADALLTDVRNAHEAWSGMGRNASLRENVLGAAAIGITIGVNFASPEMVLERIGATRVLFAGIEVRAVRDLSHLSESTLKAMAEKGFAATTEDGETIVLHHLNQNPAGPVVEMPASNHSIGNTVQHPLGNTTGAGLTQEQRRAFDFWRKQYWKARAQEELVRRAK